MTIKIGINGLGRIGRCVLRAIFENYDNSELELVAVNAPSPTNRYTHLINYDSVHGKFAYKAIAAENSITIKDKEIRKTSFRNIEDIDWQDVDIVLECSGKFNNKIDASKHLKGNVKKVLVSAPCKDADNTIIFGVNHHKITDDDKIISIGSCTTNCLAPIANILNKSIGIKKGFVTTIHSYTNDQNILDGSHKDERRARASNLSLIPTTTGAAKAIGLVLPELDGILDGSAIRVPTPNVSLIDFSFTSQRNTSTEEVNKILEKAAKEDPYNIIDYLEEKLVSIDMNHSSYSCIVDPFETKVINNDFIRVLAWYDNEWAYSLRMLDVTKLLVK